MSIIWQNLQNHLAPYLFVVYALVWTLISFMIELGPTFKTSEYWFSYSIFGCYNLSVSIVFYIILGLTSWKKSFGQSNIVGIGASVFFLRLGAIFFSIGAIVLWSIELFLAFAQSVRPWICILRTCLYIIFHVTQVVFVSISHRVEFHYHRMIVYFGLSHTIAVNLWIWASLCIAKSGIGNNQNETYHIVFDHHSPWVMHSTDQPIVVNLTFEKYEYTLRTVKYFGSTSIIFLTLNVEFCLIAFGACLCLFYTIAWEPSLHDHKKNHYIGFDYRNTGIGMLLGFCMLILSCLSVAFGNILRDNDYQKAAGEVVGIFQLAYYLISILTCGIVFQCLFKHIILNQEFVISPNRDLMPHEKNINIIFLLVGVCGEVMYCCMGLLGVIRGDQLLDTKGIVIASFLTRAIEVLIQAILLFYLLKKGGSVEPCDTIGKQSITFLIALNMILFGFHAIEGSIRTYGFPTKIDDTSKMFLKICLPLVVFFRFHCSVCFAEIWKVYYHLIPTSQSSRQSVIENTTLDDPTASATPISAEVLISSETIETNGGYRDLNELFYNRQHLQA